MERNSPTKVAFLCASTPEVKRVAKGLRTHARTPTPLCSTRLPTRHGDRSQGNWAWMRSSRVRCCVAHDRVRITPQLIDAAKESHLWAESYERDLRDVLALQSEVAQAIAREIQVRLTPQEKARFDHVSEVNPSAYEAYLKGRYYWNRRSQERFHKGVT